MLRCLFSAAWQYLCTQYVAQRQERALHCDIANVQVHASSCTSWDVFACQVIVICVLQVRLLFEMLNLNPWCYYPLTVQLLSSSYTALRAKCVPGPLHMAVTTAPMEV